MKKILAIIVIALTSIPAQAKFDLKTCHYYDEYLSFQDGFTIENVLGHIWVTKNFYSPLKFNLYRIKTFNTNNKVTMNIATYHPIKRLKNGYEIKLIDGKKTVFTSDKIVICRL
jgi:hypothetical protein